MTSRLTTLLEVVVAGRADTERVWMYNGLLLYEKGTHVVMIGEKNQSMQPADAKMSTLMTITLMRDLKFKM